MQVLRTVAEMRAAARAHRESGRRIGFVPTMGALHEGHLSLVRAARQNCDTVVLSIFVNPLQFGPSEDLSAYPRTEEQDLDLARAEGADIVFVPGEREMYPIEPTTSVVVSGIGDVLEGAERPGHFNGVAVVVTKLFNIVEPDVAFFGQKDAQQAALIKRMAADLSFGIEIAICPTVREPDGLALSSRNRYLSSRERAHATALYRALELGQDLLLQGSGVEVTVKEMTRSLEAADGVTLAYARAVDPDTFGVPRPDRPVLLAVAARVGPARLIDNMLVSLRSPGTGS